MHVSVGLHPRHDGRSGGPDHGTSAGVGMPLQHLTQGRVAADGILLPQVRDEGRRRGAPAGDVLDEQGGGVGAATQQRRGVAIDRKAHQNEEAAALRGEDQLHPLLGAPVANNDRTRSLIAAIVPTGIVAGLLDGTAAVIAHLLRGGRAPERIFKYIASAALGPTATTGGWEMVAVGVLFHMTIAMGWTALFYLAATRVSVLNRCHY